jgi:hypothetical protein
MPRYYFHVLKNGLLEKDLEGADFPSPEAAREEALTAAREMLAELLLADQVIDGASFEITDDAGVVVDRIPFRSVIRTE